MQENMKINVKYTLEDAKGLFRAQEFSGAKGILKILNIIIMMLLLLITVVAIFVAAVLFKEFGETDILPIFMVAMLLFVSFFGFVFFMPFLRYHRQVKQFEKSKLIGALCHFEISDTCIEFQSDFNIYSLKYNEVYKIREYKPCFLIGISPAAYWLLPKRCFQNQSQLDQFTGLLLEKVDRKKRKIKRYPLMKSMPDYFDDSSIKPVEQFKSPDIPEEQPLLELEVNLTKEDVLRFNFRQYFFKPFGIVVTALGLLIILANLFHLIRSGLNFEDLTRILVGLAFVIPAPLFIYIMVNKLYRSNTAALKPQKYKFFHHFFLIESSSGLSRVDWHSMKQTTETKRIIIFQLSTKTALVIPKTALEGNDQAIETIRDLIHQNKKNPNRS